MIKLFTAVLMLSVCLNAQQFDSLKLLDNTKLKTYYSAGQEAAALKTNALCEDAYAYFTELFSFAPDIPVFVLDSTDWKKYAQHPLYGMPHYTDDHRLVVAATDNPFWKSFIPPIDNLNSKMAEQVRNAYTTEDGSLSMKAFFDKLAVHELAHGFHVQKKITMQRFWIQELFVNIALHTYTAEKNPEGLPSLEAFPEMVVASGTEGFKYTSLADFEARYDRMNARNYGWYQCRLHVAAKNLYNKNGKDLIVNLWNALGKQEAKLSDDELNTYLENNAAPEISMLIKQW